MIVTTTMKIIIANKYKKIKKFMRERQKNICKTAIKMGNLGGKTTKSGN